MRVFREPEPEYGKEALTFALGAAGGLAIGLLLARNVGSQPAGRLGTDLRERARTAGERARGAVRRIEPARLRRHISEETELTELEDAVLDAFLADSVLSERGVDVGAISQGIVELSGSVESDEEADLAVRVANAVPGVRTVVNRLSTEEGGRANAASRRLARKDGNVTSIQRGTARTGGMGTRRQSRLTDPDRPDDSQHFEERALRRADRDQWMEEGYAAANPRTSSRETVRRTGADGFAEDELDNQDPHGKHAPLTLDSQPREPNTGARVGESSKPAIEMNIDRSGLRGEGASGEDNDQR